MQPSFEPLLPVAQALRPYVRRKTTDLLVIYGSLGAGKSTLSRYLAWKFNVSLLELDLFRKHEPGIVYREDDLARVIKLRQGMTRALIVEGYRSLEALEAIKISPTASVHVIQFQDAGIDPLRLIQESDSNSTIRWKLELNAAKLFEAV